MAGCCQQDGFAVCEEEPGSGAREIPEDENHSDVSSKGRGNGCIKGGARSEDYKRSRYCFPGNLRWTSSESLLKLAAVVWIGGLWLAIAPAYLSRRCCTFTYR